MRIHTPFAFVVLLATSSAAQTAEPTIDLGTAGSWIASLRPPDALALRSAADGEAIELVLPVAFPADAAIETVSPLEGPGAARAARLTLAGPAEDPFEILVGVSPDREPRLIWAGFTALRGDPGERRGFRVETEDDLDGDGAPDILVGGIAEGVAICGGEPALLHRRAWDWRGGALRPVSGPRPGIPAGGGTIVRMSDAPPENAGALVPLLEFRAASSSLGDGGDPARALPPRGLEDMDGRTGWAEGVGGSGRYEFASASLVTDRLAARWIAVRQTDDTAADAVETRNRPRAIGVVDAAGGAWRLELPDNAGRAGDVLWFELPAPVEGGCLTIVLLDTWPAVSAPGRTANVTWISDLQAFALVAPGDEPTAVAAVLDDDASSAAAERLLRALGDRGVEVVRDLLPSLQDTGAARAAAYLAGRPEPSAVEAIVEMLVSTDPTVARAAREAVARRGEDATGALLALIVHPAPGAAQIALEMIGDVGGAEALPVLIARAGYGDAEERAALRRALNACLVRHPEEVAGILEAVGAAAEAGREVAATDLLRALPPAEPGALESRTETLRAVLERAATFEARYHLLRLAGDVAGPHVALLIGAVRASATEAAEPEIRATAAETLGRIAPGTMDLTPLLDDPWPAVRLAAVSAIASRNVEREVLALAAHYGTERWPAVRAAAAEAFLAGPWPGDEAVRRLLDDGSRIVRDRVVGALDTRGDDPALALLGETVRDRSERADIRRRAMDALARHCWRDLKPSLIPVIEASVRAGASGGEQSLALDAIALLGLAGPPGVRSLLEEIVREAPVGLMRAAALTALGNLREPEARPVLETYVDAADPAVREAARTALRTLEDERRPAPRCRRIAAEPEREPGD